MKPIIYQTFFKRGNSLCHLSTQFPVLKLHRTTETKFSPYKVENASNAVFMAQLDRYVIPTKEDDIVGFDNVEGTVKPIDEFDQLVVEIHRDSNIEEIICRQVTFSQRKSNYIGKGIVFESELYLTPIVTDNDYNLRTDKYILLTSECTDITIYSYFTPRPLPIDHSHWILNPRYVPLIRSRYDDMYKAYYTFNYGVRDLITHLEIEERINEKVLLIRFSKIIYEREYTKSPSHSSMDPEPIEVSEYTKWKIILCLQFCTSKEVKEFLSKTGAISESNPIITWVQRQRVYKIQFDTPKTLTEIEHFIGFKFIEEWKTERYES